MQFNFRETKLCFKLSYRFGLLGFRLSLSITKNSSMCVHNFRIWHHMFLSFFAFADIYCIFAIFRVGKVLFRIHFLIFFYKLHSFLSCKMQNIRSNAEGTL